MLISNDNLFLKNKKTKFIFLRHAETQKNPDINATFWDLTELGKIQAEKTADLPIMNKVDVIYVSIEKKTSLTAKPLSKKINKKLNSLSFFNEVRRGNKFLTKEDFEIEKIKQLKDLNYHAFDGESGNEALERFKLGIEQISKNNVGKTILIVTHGTILNIYFAYLLDSYDKLPERWQKTNFCVYGIVENEKVLKDIV